MPKRPIQEEPESTVGRKPERVEQPAHREAREQPPEAPARSGAAIRREEGDETEAGGEIRERERGEPPVVRGLDE